MPNKLVVYITLGLFVLVQIACVKHRHLVNFNEGPEFNTLQGEVNRQPIRIQPDDLIEISVQTGDKVTDEPFRFNTIANPQSVGTETAGNSKIFRVDQSGTIQFPMLGATPVSNLSTSEIRDSLKARLKKYYTTPVIDVRLVSFRFSVLGEVRNPGSFSVNREQTNVLEALGMAGDLTNYGNRQNLLLVRERSGEREFAYLNLHDRAIFDSPYFYLQPGDVIYVEPIKAKIGATADGSTKYLQWALPVVSVISIVVSLLR